MRGRLVFAISVLCCGACSQPGSAPADMAPAPADLRPAADTKPPAFAGLKTVISAGASALTLSWAPATDAVTATAQLTYLVFQSTLPASQTFSSPTYATGPGVTTFSAIGLQSGTRYYYVVRARDQAGNTDSNNVELSAVTDQTPDTQPPMFAGLTGATSTGNTVTLSWTAATDDRTPPSQILYLVYQSLTTGGETFNQATYAAAAGTTEYSVTGLNARTTYYFAVRARDLSGNTDTNVAEQSALTGDISFSGQVQPIFDRCAGCHGTAMAQQSLNLADAATSYANLVGRLSTECTADALVKPGQPDQSYLVWKFQGMGPCFVGAQMPLGSLPSPGDVNTVRGWIQAGAPNN